MRGKLKRYGAVIALMVLLALTATIFLVLNVEYEVKSTVITLPPYDYEGDDWFRYHPDGVKLEVGYYD